MGVANLGVGSVSMPQTTTPAIAATPVTAATPVIAAAPATRSQNQILHENPATEDLGPGHLSNFDLHFLDPALV